MLKVCHISFSYSHLVQIRCSRKTFCTRNEQTEIGILGPPLKKKMRNMLLYLVIYKADIQTELMNKSFKAGKRNDGIKVVKKNIIARIQHIVTIDIVE